MRAQRTCQKYGWLRRDAVALVLHGENEFCEMRPLGLRSRADDRRAVAVRVFGTAGVQPRKRYRALSSNRWALKSFSQSRCRTLTENPSNHLLWDFGFTVAHFRISPLCMKDPRPHTRPCFFAPSAQKAGWRWKSGEMRRMRVKLHGRLLCTVNCMRVEAGEAAVLLSLL